MLDIQPPEHTPHTWRDFFIHIGTIVIGLCIAIGLEQAVEAVHHHHQRAELREDLRADARLRIQRIDENIASYSNDLAWYRAVMKAGREAAVSGGFVTFTLPLKKQMPYMADLPNGVWDAARASGVVSVLPRGEVELWDSVDGDRALSEHISPDFNAREVALRAFFGITARLGLPEKNGATYRLAVKDRDLMMDAVADMFESTWQLQRDEAYYKGASQGILDGANTPDDLVQYATRAVATLPR